MTAEVWFPWRNSKTNFQETDGNCKLNWEIRHRKSWFFGYVKKRNKFEILVTFGKFNGKRDTYVDGLVAWYNQDKYTDLNWDWWSCEKENHDHPCISGWRMLVIMMKWILQQIPLYGHSLLKNPSIHDCFKNKWWILFPHRAVIKLFSFRSFAMSWRFRLYCMLM